MTVERKKNYGRTITGELITDELIEKLVQEAEQGWEIEELLTWREFDQKSEPAPGDQSRSGREI